MSILKEIKEIQISEHIISQYSFILFEMQGKKKDISKLIRNLQRMIYVYNSGNIMQASYWRGDYYNLLISEKEKLNNIRRERNFLSKLISTNTNQKRGRI